MIKKGQAAMEFLMTYGWAILVVLAAIAALAYFGVLSPSNLLPEQTTFAAPLANIDQATIDATNANVTVVLKNNVGQTITVDTSQVFTVNTPDSGCTTATSMAIVGTAAAGTATIANGAQFTVNFNCGAVAISGERFASEFTFDYVNDYSGQTHSQSGNVQLKI